MANNRLMLACQRCVGDADATLVIARLSVGNGPVWTPSREKPADVETWLETHSTCHDGYGLDVRLTSETNLAILLG